MYYIVDGALYKSVNVQYIKLGCLDNGTNKIVDQESAVGGIIFSMIS